MDSLTLLSPMECQKRICCDMRVLGYADWKDCLMQTIKLSQPWARICGGAEVPLLTYLHKEAEVNGTSFERCIVNTFLSRGYVLEELEVEFTNPEQVKWGRSIWQKDYPYPDKMDEDDDPRCSPQLYYAKFRTEHSGEQTFCLYSTQMFMSGGILIHKTVVFHKVVFSPPR